MKREHTDPHILELLLKPDTPDSLLLAHNLADASLAHLQAPHLSFTVRFKILLDHAATYPDVQKKLIDDFITPLYNKHKTMDRYHDCEIMKEIAGHLTDAQFKNFLSYSQMLCTRQNSSSGLPLIH
jgi:hypothetical protein